eukprot:366470-Chlamydomonas_euryale.AAC.11
MRWRPQRALCCCVGRGVLFAPGGLLGHTPASQLGHILSAISQLGHNPSATSLLGHNPSATSLLGHTPSATSLLGHTPSATNQLGHTPSATNQRKRAGVNCPAPPFPTEPPAWPNSQAHIGSFPAPRAWQRKLGRLVAWQGKLGRLVGWQRKLGRLIGCQGFEPYGCVLRGCTSPCLKSTRAPASVCELCYLLASSSFVAAA